MAHPVAGYGLYEALQEEGYTLPDETADVRLVLPVDGIIQLQLIINMTDVTLAQLGRALIRMADHEFRLRKGD